MKIFVDADACPVKDEVYRVAERYKLEVLVVANQWMNVPMSSLIEMKVVSGSFDAADDWIVEQSQANDIVITADILLADRCVKKSVRVIGTKGDEFTEDNIGSAVAGRELMENLRHMGEMRGGPAPMDKKARSRFLSTLDQVIQSRSNGLLNNFYIPKTSTTKESNIFRERASAVAL
ncbi:MAG: hypothetical protein B7Y39_18215 [Bdellovibrio sp. 28-41-41]|nr:MAG: hypothetical protein B7Y39_18215 [Bdellovibrio sp. 28-41-41]